VLAYNSSLELRRVNRVENRRTEYDQVVKEASQTSPGVELKINDENDGSAYKSGNVDADWLRTRGVHDQRWKSAERRIQYVYVHLLTIIRTNSVTIQYKACNFNRDNPVVLTWLKYVRRKEKRTRINEFLDQETGPPALPMLFFLLLFLLGLLLSDFQSTKAFFIS